MEERVTRDRVWRAAATLAEIPAPSTAASAFRGEALRALLAEGGSGAMLDLDHERSGSAAILVGSTPEAGRLWYFAHLDTISYLIGRREGAGYALVPYCYHLTAKADGPLEPSVRSRRVLLPPDRRRHPRLAGWRGRLRPDGDDPCLRPGDRVVPVARCRIADDGTAIGHFDNAGGVAALVVAAAALAEAGEHATIFLPDEEEGPAGTGNQTIGRGGMRLVASRPPPDLAIVSDMQQAAVGAVGPHLGAGAVLSEYASLGRGSVTPPHLFAAAVEWSQHACGPGASASRIRPVPTPPGATTSLPCCARPTFC